MSLVWEILWCLVAALAIGTVLGWVLHRLVRIRLQVAQDDTWQRRFAEQDELIGVARAELQERSERNAWLEDELASVQETLAERDAVLEELRGRLTTLEAALQEKSSTNDGQVAELTVLRQRLDAADDAARTAAEQAQLGEHALAVRLSEQSEALQERQRHIAMLEERLAALEPRRGPVTAPGELEAFRRDLQISFDELSRLRDADGKDEPVLTIRERIVELELGLEPESQDSVVLGTALVDESFPDHAPAGHSDTQPRPQTQPAPQLDADDLTLIKGVGPVLERVLHDMGIVSFRQIATWTRDDIAQVSARLGAFKRRIDRENWVEGARQQFIKKYGTEP